MQVQKMFPNYSSYGNTIYIYIYLYIWNDLFVLVAIFCLQIYDTNNKANEWIVSHLHISGLEVRQLHVCLHRSVLLHLSSTTSTSISTDGGSGRHLFGKRSFGGGVWRYGPVDSVVGHDAPGFKGRPPGNDGWTGSWGHHLHADRGGRRCWWEGGGKGWWLVLQKKTFFLNRVFIARIFF